MATILRRGRAQTIWDMREAGVPVKRIARHLGRQNVVAAQVHCRRTVGGARHHVSARELRLSLGRT